MLSIKEPPPPIEEVLWHADRCSREGTTFLATTRDIVELNSGISEVALYAGASLENKLLGKATFVDLVSFTSQRGRALFEASDLYKRHGVPRNTQMFIGLADFTLVDAGDTLETLDGVIRASGLPLTRKNLPGNQWNAEVYYFKTRRT